MWEKWYKVSVSTFITMSAKSMYSMHCTKQIQSVKYIRILKDIAPISFSTSAESSDSTICHVKNQLPMIS